MSNNPPLAVKDLVWGKVEPYPWWPGKIIQIMSQDNTQIYKVSFFGDSSYSFLKKQCITMFSFFDFDLNSSFSQNLKLQKAVKEANKLFLDKKTMNKANQNLNTTLDISQKLIEQIPQESTSIKAKADGDSNQQIFECPETNHEIEVNDIFSTQITSENVLSLIESLSSVRHGNLYSYSERKQTINYRQKLKQGLLAKYNLVNFLKENSLKATSQASNLSTVKTKSIRKVKTLRKQNLVIGKQNFNLQKDKIKYSVLNKIYRTFGERFELEEAKTQSRILYDFIEQKSKGSSEHFMKLTIRLIDLFKNLDLELKGQELVNFLMKKLEQR